jgi:phage terminase small subunit
MPPNPNKANQYTPDERQQVCWDLYVKSIQKGKPNAYQAAIDAGYEETSAIHITLTRWFLDRESELFREKLLSKAEKKLDQTLTFKVEDDEGNIKTDLLRIQTDVSKHITSTVGKKYYSNKMEDAASKIADVMETNALSPEMQALSKEYAEKLKKII